MKDTLFLEILKYWDRFDKQEKLKHLQLFESLNAKFENRSEREIVLCKTGHAGSQEVGGRYSFDAPSIIQLDSNFSRKDAIDNMSIVFEEGFHSLVDDFFNRHTDLKALTPIDEKKLKEEYSLKHIIYNRAAHEGLLTLFSLKYYEEHIVKEETCLYLIYNLLQTCESLEDCKILFGIYYYKILGKLYNVNNFTKQLEMQASPKTYEYILQLVKNVDAILFKQHVLDNRTTNKIISGFDPQILNHFDKNYKLFVLSQQNAKNDHMVKDLVSKMIENINIDSFNK